MDSNACIIGHHNDKDNKGSATKDPKDLFDMESSSNGTDADTSNKDSDKGNDTSDGDTKLDKLSTNPKALKKYLVNEVTIIYSFGLKLMWCYLALHLVEG